MAEIIKCISVKSLENNSNRIFMLGNEKINVGETISLFYRDKIEQYIVTDIFESSDDIKMNHYIIPVVCFPKTKDEYFQYINIKHPLLLRVDEKNLMDKDVLFDYWLRCKNNVQNCYIQNETFEKILCKLIDKKEVSMDDVPKELMSIKIFMRICKTDLDKYKDVLIEEIESGAITLRDLPNKLKSDKEYILPLIKKHPSVYKEKIADSLKIDKDIIRTTFQSDPFIFYYFPKEVKNNKEFVLECIKYEGYILKYLNKELRNDDEIIYEAFKSGLAHYDENDYARRDYVSMIQVLDSDYFVKDKEIAKKIVADAIIRINDYDCELKYLIKYFSDQLKNDEEIISLVQQLYTELQKDKMDYIFVEQLKEEYPSLS